LEKLIRYRKRSGKPIQQYGIVFELRTKKSF